MLGSEECPGVVSLMAIELYRHVDKNRIEGHSCDVAVAYLEFYNEVVYVVKTENLTSTSKGISVSKSGAQWVPYQDSKLAHILKDCLSGTCGTLMIAAVSPSKLSYNDTHNTLKYAEQDMKIKQQAKKHVLNVNVLKPMYRSFIEEYKEKEEGLQRKLD
nr:kinesin-like protein KIF18B [Rhipicephalus microplus]